uniref:Uncharacterized protein n=1 Tax=Tolypothrix bouteillei VB521301 TaxID=1479485 RepID=A0A0C1R2K4_9CYAN
MQKKFTSVHQYVLTVAILSSLGFSAVKVPDQFGSIAVVSIPLLAQTTVTKQDKKQLGNDENK